MRWSVRYDNGTWDVTRPDGSWSATYIYWTDALNHAIRNAATWNAMANATANLSWYERNQAREMLEQTLNHECDCCKAVQ